MLGKRVKRLSLSRHHLQRRNRRKRRVHLRLILTSRKTLKPTRRRRKRTRRTLLHLTRVSRKYSNSLSQYLRNL